MNYVYGVEVHYLDCYMTTEEDDIIDAATQFVGVYSDEKVAEQARKQLSAKKYDIPREYRVVKIPVQDTLCDAC